MYEPLNMHTPSTSEHSRKHQINNDTSSSNKQNMPDVLCEHQYIMLENFETIYTSTNRTVPFMSQSFIADLAILCNFMPNDWSLWGSSLIPSLPPQKLLCRIKLAIYTRQKVHMSCFRIETYLLRCHTQSGHILL